VEKAFVAMRTRMSPRSAHIIGTSRWSGWSRQAILLMAHYDRCRQERGQSDEAPERELDRDRGARGRHGESPQSACSSCSRAGEEGGCSGGGVAAMRNVARVAAVS